MNAKQIEQLRAALQASPENTTLRQMLAEALLASENYAEAEQEYAVLRRGDAADRELGLGHVKALRGAGRPDDALMVIEHLIQDNPLNPDLLQQQIKLFQAAGRVEDAVHAYKNMIEDFPDRQDEEFEQQYGVNAADEADVLDGRIRQMDGEIDTMLAELERPLITFDDVGGMEDLKNEIRLKIIEPLKNPEIFKAYGKKMGGGILMYGPPGCGKTFIAKATAGEAGLVFISVGIHDILDMWIGNSERNLHELFELARRNAPAILFFDEVDALGASRSDLRQSAGRHLVNQFLAEMDGTNGSNEGLLVLAATNTPWHVDTAFRRPGRFDRVLFVPPPDQTAREQILELKLKDKPVEPVNTASIAKRCPDFSGADITALIELAIEDKLQISLKKGVVEKLTEKDLVKAAKRMRPSTKEWFASAKNHAVYANQSGAYDDILNYLKSR
ncbi:MAG: AAA family ATPase [Pontiellaceae bacterium]|nr:AAA family ATPase [Pontiellaceae bacterium]